MDANKQLNKQIFIEVLVAFVFLGLLIIGGYAIYSSVKGNKVLANGDLILDLSNKDVASNLYIMGDSAGLNTKPYIANITNNSKRKVKCNLTLKNDISSSVKVEDYLRVTIDDGKIKYLKDFEIDKKGNYILVSEDIEKGYTKTHTIKVWFSSESPNTLSGLAANISFAVNGE